MTNARPAPDLFALTLAAGLVLALLPGERTTGPVAVTAMAGILAAAYLLVIRWRQGLSFVGLSALWLVAVMLSPSFVWLLIPLAALGMQVWQRKPLIFVASLSFLGAFVYVWWHRNQGQVGVVLLGLFIGVVLVVWHTHLSKALPQEAPSPKSNLRHKERQNLAQQIYHRVAVPLHEILWLTRKLENKELAAQIEDQYQLAHTATMQLVHDLNEVEFDGTFVSSIEVAVDSYNRQYHNAYMGFHAVLDLKGDCPAVLPNEKARLGFSCVTAGLKIAEQAHPMDTTIVVEFGTGVMQITVTYSSGMRDYDFTGDLQELGDSLAAAGGSITVSADRGFQCSIPLT